MEFLSEIINRETFLIEHGSHVRDSIIIVLEGEFCCTIGSKSFTVAKHDICVFRKETVFDRKVLKKLRCVYIQFEAFPISLQPGLLQTADPVRTENSIGYLAKAVEDGNQELTSHFLWDILYLHRSRSHATDPMVADCIAYFHRHYSQHICLDTLVQKYAISKQGLIQKFRKSVQKTPMEYLSMLRVNQSKLLLRDTALSVSQIAEACGFENVYYFSNCFKRHTGASPSAYRKLLDL